MAIPTIKRYKTKRNGADNAGSLASVGRGFGRADQIEEGFGGRSYLDVKDVFPYSRDDFFVGRPGPDGPTTKGELLPLMVRLTAPGKAARQPETQTYGKSRASRDIRLLDVSSGDRRRVHRHVRTGVA